MPLILTQVAEVNHKLTLAQLDPDYVAEAKPSENVWLFISVRDAKVVPKRKGDSEDPNERVRAFIDEGDQYHTAMANEFLPL